MGGILLAAGVFSPLFSAVAGEVRGVGLSQGATGTRAEIELQGTGEFQTLSLSGPDRLVVDLPASSAKPGLKLPAGAGIVKSVRTGQPAPGTLRIVFDLSSSVAALKPHMEPSANGAKLVIEWPGDGPAPASAAVASNAPTSSVPSPPQATPSAAQATAALATAVKQQASAPAPQTTPSQSQPTSPQDILNGRDASAATTTAAAPPKPASVPLGDYLASKNAPAAPATDVPAAPQVTESVPAPMRSGMRPLVVAIDAGHGGQDSGAIGPTGKYEKNVTLAIARELARQVDATQGLKAYLVRDGDYFIPLNQRAQKARAHKADIFVSIHADAAENRSASGSSVYVLALRGASSQRARWLADKENASDLVGGVNLQKADNTLTSVLIDLAQSGHMKASEDAASHVLDGLKRIGNNHKPQIERANFAVLRTSDMPAMLVETAFISNYDEERRLTDPSYQRKLAGAVLDGVQTYFTRSPPPGTLFAARAQAGQGSGAVGGGSP
ncbi:N-acetylmuramoyl-L-alanine amidase [Pseudoxanthomonas helianthi]|uniref:N-acetylmuramoyl-L-alanine amidase AmiC n=1 Tax=Pseudoxanthomonas helianthi TaxID=1453541 RepID=A0A940X605_9GAMM|nr:N-acetylmuramoyl-L-alanine amidase [Pseudoxanthomonas helianthi]MBP3985821.1 N-acetylmuramoyl-L-alanine amidase [Pseudoxanthomonas helianthi]